MYLMTGDAKKYSPQVPIHDRICLFFKNNNNLIIYLIIIYKQTNNIFYKTYLQLSERYLYIYIREIK